MGVTRTGRRLAIYTLAATLAACTATQDRSAVTSSTTSLPDPPTTVLQVDEIDVCELLTREEVAGVTGDVAPGEQRTIAEGNTQCTWRTSTGGFQETEVVVQVTNGGEGSSALPTLEILRDAMEGVEEVPDLGDGAYSAEWSDEGTAVVVATGQYLMLVATDQADSGDEILSLAQSAEDRLP